MPYKIQKKGAKHCVVKEGGAQIACHDTRAKALAQMRALYANEKAELVGIEVAHGRRLAGIECCEEHCERAFLNFEQMVEHAEAVHTFDDLRKLVHEVVREQYGRTGDYKATPPVPSIWTWIEDMATDWVVFTVEEGNETTLYKASYSVVDGNVTLGEPVEVRRRTVYEPVKKSDD